MTEAVIVGAIPTPIGRLGGQLAPARPDDLAVHVLEALVARSAIDPAEIAEIYMGCANQAGEDNRNVARMAGLLAGLPLEVPGVTSGAHAAIPLALAGEAFSCALENDQKDPCEKLSDEVTCVPIEKVSASAVRPFVGQRGSDFTDGS